MCRPSLCSHADTLRAVRSITPFTSFKTSDIDARRSAISRFRVLISSRRSCRVVFQDPVAETAQLVTGRRAGFGTHEVLDTIEGRLAFGLSAHRHEECGIRGCLQEAIQMPGSGVWTSPARQRSVSLGRELGVVGRGFPDGRAAARG